MAVRWNATTDFVEKSLKSKPALKALFVEMMDSENELYDPDIKLITNDDWSIFLELLNLLKPFKDATVTSSGEHITSLSIQLPWYDELMSHLERKKVTLINY